MKTVYIKNGRVNSVYLTASHKFIYQRIFHEGFVEDLEVKIQNRKKQHDTYIITFISTNARTVEENIEEYLNPVIAEQENSKKLKEFNKNLLKELDEVLTEEDYLIYS